MAHHDSLEDALNAFGASDLIPHDKLILIARNAWRQMPATERSSSQAVEKWRAAIYKACKPSLDVAVASLEERNGDERSLLSTKLVLLRETFTKQVDRAMRDLSEGDRAKRDQAKAMDAVNAMVKQLRKAE